MISGMKEMNLKDMETVSGGFNVKRILDSFSMKDVFLCTVLGPFGQAMALTRVGVDIAAEIYTSK